jgi:hypothetical protein
MQSSHIMVLLIVAMALFAGVMKSRYRAEKGIVTDKKGNESLAADPDAQRLKEEVAVLKERIQVLERIATENNSANDITRQIEELRGK